MVHLSDVLCPNECCLGDRRALTSLAPGERVMDDVLCLVAAMASKQNESDISKRWWLPPSFGEIALNTTGYDPSLLAAIKKKFMGWADRLAHVFVLLLRNGHWYLMIVDMFHSELIYLDSMKNDDDTAERKK
ncbi:hypothetical protein PIB30_083716 [Stylosanthes scabra]|uniref:Ubiquitin-like protease family profile domain-containing protein n=1 Tax=Stylosanthes scabra TaxID=79078 RepID=A0ABU6UU46_9FABA|nr:hypothetical protein [Stylosanthes scabra]